MRMLAADRVDLVISDLFSGQVILKRLRLDGIRAVGPEPPGESQWSAAPSRRRGTSGQIPLLAYGSLAGGAALASCCVRTWLLMAASHTT